MANANASLFLFCAGEESSYVNQSVDLFAYSATSSGVIASLPLFVPDNSGYNAATATLPLWATGSPVPVTANFTLYARGCPLYHSDAMTLFAANSGAAGALNLYASGLGTTAGAVPLSGVLPLYLHRPHADALLLYCLAPGFPASGQLLLYAQGGASESGVLPLSAPYTQGESAANLDLYAGGI